MVELKKWKRNRKVASYLFQLMEVRLDEDLPNETIRGLHDFVHNGKDYVETVNIPKYCAELDFKLENDTKKQCNLSLKRQKITSEDKMVEQASADAFMRLQRKLNGEFDNEDYE